MLAPAPTTPHRPAPADGAPQRWLRGVCLGALALVAILSLSSHLMTRSLPDDQQAATVARNLAGRQRLLSEQIVRASLETVADCRGCDLPECPARMIATTLETMDRVHAGLIEGDDQLGLRPNRRGRTVELHAQLGESYGDMAGAARDLLGVFAKVAGEGVGEGDDEAVTRAVAGLRDAQGRFLPRMELLVAELDAQQAAAAARTRMYSLAVLIGQLGVLSALALLVFEPAVRTIRAQFAELVRERERAEAAAATKGRFLANMSHEIRTPMTAILGYAALLDDPSLSEAERFEALRTLRASGDHLLTLLNDVLDLSKIEAGQMRVQLGPCDPERVAREVAAMMRLRASGKNLALEVSIDPSVPPAVLTDASRVRQVLVNLVGNAVKFTDAGSVGLRVWRDEAAGELVFGVTDTGPGMTPEELRRAFIAFEQGSDLTTRRHGGTGLGLTISRSLARELGGDVVAFSRPGEGSRFELRLPAIVAAPEAEPTQAPSPAGPGWAIAGRVLLVDDGPDNRRLIGTLLRRAGAEVDEAEDGRAGVEIEAASRAAGRPYALILMDVQMPRLDGCDATVQMRESGCLTPVVALTAHAQPEDRRRCRDAGCDDFLLKPVDRATLLGCAARWTGRRHEPARPALTAEG